ncbi:MAG TPA: hypothetical protein VF332_02990, partial [Vicinamibacterales bacterium]
MAGARTPRALAAIDAGFRKRPGDGEHAEEERREQEDGEVCGGRGVAAGPQRTAGLGRRFPADRVHLGA